MPSQHVLEQMLKAFDEDDSETLAFLTQQDGPFDAEDAADRLYNANTFYDPKTRQRILKVFARRNRRFENIDKIRAEQEKNAREDGPGHGPFSKKSNY